MNNQQRSLHPIVLYYREENESDVVSTSICFISDDLKHGVNFVYKVIKGAIKYICDNITEALYKVHYFSDGGTGQHKNCKNFLTLCLHNSDFRLKCEWNFLPPVMGSHHDGIGETIKQLVTRASLQ